MPPRKPLSRTYVSQPNPSETSDQGEPGQPAESSGRSLSVSPKLIVIGGVVLVAVIGSYLAFNKPSGNQGNVGTIPPPPAPTIATARVPAPTPAPAPQQPLVTQPAKSVPVAAVTPVPVTDPPPAPAVPIPATAPGSTPQQIDTSWLPENSQIVGQINVRKILSAPILQPLLKDPSTQLMLGQWNQFLGFKLADIETITFGVGIRLDALLQPPEQPVANAPDPVDVCLVIRTAWDLVPETLTYLKANPASASGTGQKLYSLQLPQAPGPGPAPPELSALVVAPRIMVVGLTQSVRPLAGKRNSGAQNDFKFAPANADFAVAIATPGLAEWQRQLSTVTQGALEVSDEFQTFVEHSRGSTLSVELQKDVTVNIGVAVQQGSVETILGELQRRKSELQDLVAAAASSLPVEAQELQASLTRVVADSTLKPDGDRVALSFKLEPTFFSQAQQVVGPMVLAMMLQPPPTEVPSSSAYSLLKQVGLDLEASHFRKIDGPLEPPLIAKNLPAETELFAATRWTKPTDKSSQPPGPSTPVPALRIDLTLLGEPEAQIVQYRGLTLEEARTASTKMLKRQAVNEFPYSTIDTWLTVEQIRRPARGRGVAIPIEFVNVGPVNSITSLAGQVEVRSALEVKLLELEITGDESWFSPQLAAAGVKVLAGTGEYANQMFLMPESDDVAILDVQLEKKDPPPPKPKTFPGQKGPAALPTGTPPSGAGPRRSIPEGGPPPGFRNRFGPPAGSGPQTGPRDDGPQGPPGGFPGSPNPATGPQRDFFEGPARHFMQVVGEPQRPPRPLLAQGPEATNPRQFLFGPGGGNRGGPQSNPNNRPPGTSKTPAATTGPSRPTSGTTVAIPVSKDLVSRPRHWSPRGYQVARVAFGHLTVRVARGLSTKSVEFEFRDLAVPSAPADAGSLQKSWVAATDPSLPEGLNVAYVQARWADPKDSGRLRRLILSVDLVGPLADRVWTVGQYQLTECVPDDGPILSLDELNPEFAERPAGFDAPNFAQRGTTVPPNTFRFEIPVLSSKASFGSLTKLAGSVRVKIAEDQPEAIIGKVSQFVGKRIANEVLMREKLALQLKEADGKIAVAVPKKDRDRVAWIELLNADGISDLNFAKTLDRENKEFDYHIFDPGKTPLDELGLRIVINQGGRVKNVAFQFENIPVPAAK